MKSASIEVAEKSIRRADFANLILIVGSLTRGKCNVLVGSPGLPIVIQEMHTGDAILYDTLEEEVLEVRLTSIRDRRLGFLVTSVSPRTVVERFPHEVSGIAAKH